MGGAGSDPREELTGWDPDGIEVYGDRTLDVGDLGSGDEGPQPINETTRLPAPPTELIELYGGALDGSTVRPLRAPTRDLEQLVIVDADGNASDEMYLARPFEGRWYGVHADMLQAVVRSDEVHIKDPDPLELRMRLQEVFGPDAKLMIPVCAPGEHRWTEWRRTPGGNRTRICVICQTGQGAIL